MMKVSLIICTRNRGTQLKRCLSAVAEIAYAKPWELILVDNGSTDDTQEVIAAFAEGASFEVRYLHEPSRGLARARNTGLAAATSDLVAFTDDDCYPAPDFLDAVEKAFEDPEIGYVGGRIRLFDPDDYPITILESLEPLEFRPGEFLRSGAVQGANMSFRRALLLAIGGFDPRFGSGAAFPCEDIDAVGRASLAGWGGVYAPDVVVFHHHGRKLADAAALMRSYDLGRGAYHMKLLLRYGRVDWFLLRLKELWWRRDSDRASVIAELRGGLEYAWSLARSGLNPWADRR